MALKSSEALATLLPILVSRNCLSTAGPTSPARWWTRVPATPAASITQPLPIPLTLKPQSLAAKLKAAGTKFVIEQQVRFKGLVGEQATIAA